MISRPGKTNAIHFFLGESPCNFQVEVKLLYEYYGDRQSTSTSPDRLSDGHPSSTSSSPTTHRKTSKAKMVMKGLSSIAREHSPRASSRRKSSKHSHRGSDDEETPEVRTHAG